MDTSENKSEKMACGPGVPSSFRLNDGCHNCEHCFRLYDYDKDDYLYCTKLSPRPAKCNSDAMEESCVSRGEYNIWLIWSFDHAVLPEGICDEFKRKTV